jgi:hypothetical protein
LKVFHLNGPTTLTITDVTEEMTFPRAGGRPVKSVVVWFKECAQGLILNGANRATMIGLYGDVIKSCIGKTITVVPTDGSILILKQRAIVQSQSVPVVPQTPLITETADGQTEFGFALPTTESEFISFTRANGIGGDKVHGILGMSAKTYLDRNPDSTWSDIARMIIEHLK